MIRFRFREDEKRYINLISEVYRLVGSHLPPAEASTVMRNLGKLQDLLMLEGVRQGVAAAAVSNIANLVDQQDLEHLKAFQLHAHVYGSQDTPLREIEEEWLEKLGSEHYAESPWLDPEPMRFAPDTEHAYSSQLQAERKAAPEPREREAAEGTEPWPPSWPHTDEDDADLDDIERLLDEDSGETQEQPQLLDQIRDALQNMASQGVRPRDWEDLILRLHMQLHVDAGYIDIQLGTAMGRNVLAQSGFHDIQPGPFGTNLGRLMQEAATTTTEIAPAKADEG